MSGPMQGTINGLKIDRLMQTLDAIKQNPELAQFRFKAHNRWIDGDHNQTHIRDFDVAGQPDESRDHGWTYNEDEPPALLGDNKGPNPVEYALTALAGCLTTSLVAHAAARGIELRAVDSHLEGDLDVRGFLGLDPHVRNGYRNIRVTFHIDADAPDEQIAELVQLAQQRSPVFDMMTHEVPVEVGYDRQQTPQGAAPAA